jgi:predicted glycoside hydrolase/deacetylase ChbG (UPF0249 family)
MTRIWLVADDYGISKSVNHAIRDLISHGRLSATSVMTVAPGFDPEEARLLLDAAASTQATIGLHLTLTAPFTPLSPGYGPTRNEKFLPLGRTFASAFMGRFDRRKLDAEIRAQIEAFAIAFGRSPDYIDGHQHVHLLRPIAESLLSVIRTEAPDAWVRQCGRFRKIFFTDRKAALLDVLSLNFRRRAARHGVRTNPAFAGTYDFHPDARFEHRFGKFLDAMTEGGVIMCHPGIVDETLASLDPLTTLREREYAYFRSDAFTAELRARGISLR